MSKGRILIVQCAQRTLAQTHLLTVNPFNLEEVGQCTAHLRRSSHAIFAVAVKIQALFFYMIFLSKIEMYIFSQIHSTPQ